MNIMDVGRVCRKTRGRDAGEICVIVDRIDKNYVMVEGGSVRRRKTNVTHLEPLPKTIEINKNAQKETVVELLDKELA